jgi:prepilin signal peptidase PulO-like enzyme (type II secretory pathway)
MPPISLPTLPSFEALRQAALHSTPAFPPEIWWLPILVLALLGLAAAIDAIKGVVPDILIVIGLFALIAILGFEVSWPFAAGQLGWGIAAAIAIWAINELWFQMLGHEAIGMGDAKWTLLAAAGFGIVPVLFAWGAGACIAVLAMGLLFAARKPVTRLHFAPFLFLGLLVAIYWLRLR